MIRISWTVELQLDKRTKLDKWQEDYIYEHRKLGDLEEEMNRKRGL